VNVPRLPSQDMSEDAILDIMGHEHPLSGDTVAESRDLTGDTRPQKNPEQGTHEKHCYKCNRGFPTTMHICPFCHTYIATLRDF
jgi:hypothetical protein